MLAHIRSWMKFATNRLEKPTNHCGLNTWKSPRSPRAESTALTKADRNLSPRSSTTCCGSRYGDIPENIPVPTDIRALWRQTALTVSDPIAEVPRGTCLPYRRDGSGRGTATERNRGRYVHPRRGARADRLGGARRRGHAASALRRRAAAEPREGLPAEHGPARPSSVACGGESVPPACNEYGRWGA
jgi:hypothetical protein